jgi:hypothetical protein
MSKQLIVIVLAVILCLAIVGIVIEVRKHNRHAAVPSTPPPADPNVAVPPATPADQNPAPVSTVPTEPSPTPPPAPDTDQSSPTSSNNPL